MNLKIRKIKEALAAQGPLPDVLGLVEVENEAVVGQLAMALGYKNFVMTNGSDRRGIDCALLYRTEKLRLVEFIEKPLEHPYFPTRNLSAGVFQLSSDLGGDYIAISENHWPSQGSPTPARLLAAKQEVQFLSNVQAKYSKFNIQLVVMGDFNTIQSEKPNPIDDIILAANSPVPFSDTRELAIQSKNPYMDQLPKGTYYYEPRDEWNQLDRIFLSNGLTDGHGLDADLASYRIHSPEFMAKLNQHGERVPMRYYHGTSNPSLAGYSDHFPVLLKLRFEN